MFGGHSNDMTGDANAATPAVAVDTSNDVVPPAGPPAPVASDTNSYMAMSDEPAETPAPSEAPVAATPAAPVVSDSDDLLNIKQQALQQLSPLIGHLDQTPEDKFRTTMMMIQASDDQALIKDAYTAAQQISDEKVRAQALLDIVNEINYFTQQGQSTGGDAAPAA